MDPIFFQTPTEFRKWLEKNHKKKTELIVGYYKKGTGKPSMTWSQSVDEALCFGWIDGIRRSIDNERYCIRFTPRRSTSTWSSVNIRKMDEMMKKGLVMQAGLEVFENRKEEKTRVASYEGNPKILDNDSETRFKENKIAWEFFISRAPSYKKLIIHWIMSAKLEATRLRRLEKAISECHKQNRISFM